MRLTVLIAACIVILKYTSNAFVRESKSVNRKKRLCLLTCCCVCVYVDSFIRVRKGPHFCNERARRCKNHTRLVRVFAVGILYILVRFSKFSFGMSCIVRVDDVSSECTARCRFTRMYVIQWLALNRRSFIQSCCFGIRLIVNAPGGRVPVLGMVLYD
jgi:hypothetical protein